ncbi:hypothetical protein ScPMuIL_018991 [Solemya velum]
MGDNNTDQDSSRALMDSSNKNNCNNGNASFTKNNKDAENSIDGLRKTIDRLKLYIYALTGIVVAGILILIIVVGVLFGQLSYEVKHHSHQPKVGEQIAKMLEREELCAPCDKVRLGPSPEEDRYLDALTRKNTQDGEQCCVETPKQLLAMLEMFIERRYREEMARGNIKRPVSSPDGTEGKDRPAAHMMGSIRKLEGVNAPGGQYPITNWIYNEDIAFMNNVDYRHGRIVIPEDGYYYVYSQVSFIEVFDVLSKVKNEEDTSSHSLSHYLYRYNIIYRNGGEERLLQNSITKCWGQRKFFGEYSSFLGAVLYFRQGDEVFVKVSNLTLIVREPKLNYFGLFRI